MKEREIDPNRLAALLDGRLTGSERDRLLSELAESPDLLEAYSDAVAAGSAVRQPSMTDVVPIAGRRRWRVSRALAAAALLVVAVGVVNYRRTGGRGVSDAELPLNFLTDSRATMPAEFARGQWPSVRGSAGALSAEKRAARAGVQFADLLLLAPADPRRDSVAGELARLLAESDNGEIAEQLVGPLVAARSATVEESSRALADAIQAILPAESFRRAVWIESARVASERRRAEFFESAPARAALGRELGSTPLPRNVASTQWAELTRLLGVRLDSLTR